MDQDFIFKCPQCDKGLKASSSLIGKSGICPGCKTRIKIPLKLPQASLKKVSSP